MDDDFSSGINPDYWTHEVRVGGYGYVLLPCPSAALIACSNHEFDWTTSDASNSFVEDGVFYIVPTLTSDVLGNDAINNGYKVNLTTDGTCTGQGNALCAATSNSSAGTIINPVQSARLTTSGKVNIAYGKVEIEARMPTG